MVHIALGGDMHFSEAVYVSLVVIADQKGAGRGDIVSKYRYSGHHLIPVPGRQEVFWEGDLNYSLTILIKPINNSFTTELQQ